MEDACREYQSSLEDLTYNSKPHINMLTILAEENLTFAKDIVAIIEAQISQAPAAEKLPVLYLVDSIVKNVGGEYLAVFAKNLITSFICVFEKVDENTRKSLFKLRSTWDEVFPLKKLYALDVRVNSVDPAWPIKPLPPTVNASIHVNPKFLKQSEEASSPQPAPPSPVAPAVVAVPAVAAPGSIPQPAPGVSQSSVTQEQLIRQQLLAKQKQLLELQQKKIELELEQTKAQLAGGFSLPTMPQASPPTTPPKPVNPTVPVVRPWIPAQTQSDAKPASTRDPRLNRAGPPAVSQPKEQPAGKKDGPVKTGSPAPEKRAAEKSTRPEKNRTPRKEMSEDKSKTLQNQNKEMDRASDAKKDPRLKKRPQDKRDEGKDEEVKEKRRNTDKKERVEASSQRASKGKLVNGSVVKHEPEFKSGGNARTHARKRSRSRSPGSSPKRKDRRSPKSRTRSSSLSPAHKPGKTRRVRPDELALHGKPGRDDRGVGSKKSQSESRRSKRAAEERRSESRDAHSPRGHEELKEAQHRWRSGWEENKHVKAADDAHMKSSTQRHKQHQAPPPRPSTPRTPKHRLSVDANLQIPEVLNSASKKDLLRRASKSLESGEISQEEFLNMAHQIKHLFQYQEEKQQRSDGWDDSAHFPAKKQPLLATPPSPQSRPPETMDAAELSYLEHKSKLRKTQVSHRAAEEEAEHDEGAGSQGEKTGSAHKYSRAPRDRAGERRSKEREEPRHGPMIEEYNHGKEFPPLKALPGLRFRRRADPRESSEREWTSPLTERQREDQRSGYDAPQRSRHPEPRRQDGAPPPGAGHRKCPSPAGMDAPRFERERLSPMQQKDSGGTSPVPRFESPNSEHSDDGPPNPEALPPQAPPKSILKAPQRAAILQHGGSPGHTPPHDPGHPPRYDGPEHAGAPRPRPPGWFDDPSHPQGQGRFEGGRAPQRFDGPMRGGEGMGRFEGHPHPPGPGRFGPVGQGPGHFEGQGPGHFEGQGPVQGPGHFEGPVQHWQHGNMAPGPMGFPQRFEGPQNQMGPMRFAGPGQPRPRYDLPNISHHFEGPPGQQGGPRFPPQHNMQPPMRPMVPPMGPQQNLPMGSQQNFSLGPQCFPDPGAPQFPPGPLTFSAQAGNFGLQPPFSQPGPAPFYNPGAPAVGLQQPVTILANMNPAFLSQTSVPLRPQTPRVVPPENHFGQVDVEYLLTKLISTGIIKPSQPEATPPAAAPPETSVVVPARPAEEEEEEEPEEDDSLPDLTGFVVDDMKHRMEGVVTRLYSGNQCCLCSMRFTSAQTDLYADHLDWHFRQNHAGKLASKKVTHRRWYYSLTDWIEFEEIADLEERAKSHFFEKENEEEVQKNQAAAKEKEFQSVRATKDQVGESCEICQEPFETNWVEEEEDWFLKDALRVDDQLFHPSCFEDYKKTSAYPDITPSPNKLLADHPLSALIKAEEEPLSCSVSAGKQEEPSEASPLLDVKKEEAELLTDMVQSEESKE